MTFSPSPVIRIWITLLFAFPMSSPWTAPVLGADTNFITTTTTVSGVCDPVRHEDVRDPARIPKIVHLSDLHIGSAKCGEAGVPCLAVAKCVTTALAGWMSQRNKDDHVLVITGDVVDRIKPDSGYPNLKEARALVAELSRSFRRVLVAPGNHDVKTNKDGKVRAASQRAFAEYLAPAPEGRPPFPRIDIIDGLAFVGVDTMRTASGDDYDEIRHHLNIGERQLGCLSDIFSRPEAFGIGTRNIVVYFHHPLSLGLISGKDGKDFGELIVRHANDGLVTALLFGHTHEPTVLRNDPLRGHAILHNAGSSTGKKVAEPAPIRLIDPAAHTVTELPIVPKDMLKCGAGQ